ncbi:MAG: hypothetical protein PHY02_06995 [Phycisphaerae bacterium]|nr:hypothetical protein [Phycisphaerae bacterium]
MNRVPSISQRGLEKFSSSHTYVALEESDCFTCCLPQICGTSLGTASIPAWPIYNNPTTAASQTRRSLTSETHRNPVNVMKNAAGKGGKDFTFVGSEEASEPAKRAGGFVSSAPMSASWELEYWATCEVSDANPICVSEHRDTPRVTKLLP